MAGCLDIQRSWPVSLRMDSGRYMTFRRNGLRIVTVAERFVLCRKWRTTAVEF